MLAIIGAVLAAFVFGFAAGSFSTGQTTSASASAGKNGDSLGESTGSASASADEVKGNTLLSSRIRELEKALAEQKTNQQSNLATRLAFFQKYHDQLRLSALRGNRELSPEMAELLGLSNEEKQRVDQLLAQTDDAISKLDNANQFIAKQDASGVTVETPADPQGKAIRDALTNSLNADIGDDRSNFLMSYLPSTNSSEPFNGFAQSKKDLIITWANKDGKLLYTIKTQFYDPKGNGNAANWYETPNLPTEDQKFFTNDSGSSP
jgi:hypothetical protein